MEDCVTLDVPSFSSLLFTFLLLYFIGSRPSTNGVGTGFDYLRRYIKLRWSSLCTGYAERLLYSSDRLWDLWVCTFAYVEQLFDCYF